MNLKAACGEVKYSYSRNGAETIVPIPNPNVTIGQYQGVSPMDIDKVNAFYQCNLCRKLFAGYSGTISSTDYPSPYPRSSSCLYLIRIPADKGQPLQPEEDTEFEWKRGLSSLPATDSGDSGGPSQILVNFKAFDIESSRNCTSDYLRVYDGLTTSCPVILDRACGNSLPPPLMSSSNVMLFEFVSNGAVSGAGFRASYNSVTCGGIYSNISGDFVTSPNYPNVAYSNNLNCVYIIIAPKGYKVVATFVEEFFLFEGGTCDTAGDYLNIYDGSDFTAPLLRKLCGYHYDRPVVTSTRNNMLLQFISDDFGGAVGFKLNYTFIPVDV